MDGPFEKPGPTLTDEELRVLACLIEKAHTTPDQYPLSSNALTTACNQKSSRDPVVDYPTKLVDETLQLLRDGGWVRMIRASGNRTFKHRHIIDEALGLDTPQQAVLAVLALRGPQSPGELKTRTERYHPFEDVADVERTLFSLRERDRPLVHDIGRQPGQSQDRWIQLLGPVDPAHDVPVGAARSSAVVNRPPTGQPAPPESAPLRSAMPGVEVPAAAGPAPGSASVEGGPTVAGAVAVIRSAGAPGPRPDHPEQSARPDAAEEPLPAAADIDGEPLSTANEHVGNIDGLHGSGWSETVFGELNQAGVHGLVATIAERDSFRGMVSNIERWNRRFDEHRLQIMAGRTGDDVRLAATEGRTAVFFGLESPSPIEGDLGLVEICHSLGVRFMQLSSDGQSLLAAGHAEDDDGGITRLGRRVIAEMNRIGLAVDTSRCGPRSTIEAITLSERPTAISRANPSWWHPSPANKGDEALRAVAETGGMLGLSLDPDLLPGGTDCRLDDFCRMIVEAAARYGVDHLGLASDLRPGRPADTGSSSWLGDGPDRTTIADGLAAVGFAPDEVGRILGGNWLRFYDHSFGPATA